MKTTLLSILLLFFFITAFSQTKEEYRVQRKIERKQKKKEKKQQKKERIKTYVNPKGKWFFGAEIGSNSINNKLTKNAKTFIQGGLLAEYYFARHWSVSTKIKYYKTGVSFYSAATGGWFGHDKNSGNFKGEVLAIPLNIKWEFRIRKNLNGFFLVGINYIKETKTSYSNYTENYNTNTYPKTYYGGNAEYGINYYLNTKSAVFIGLEHYYGGEKGMTTGSLLSNPSPIRTSNYLINIGYKYCFSKK